MSPMRPATHSRFSPRSYGLAEDAIGFAARTVGWTRYEGEKNGEENSRRAVAGVGCCLCPCGCVGSLHWLPPSSPRLRSPLPPLLPVIPAATPTAEPFPAVGFSRQGAIDVMRTKRISGIPAPARLGCREPNPRAVLAVRFSSLTPTAPGLREAAHRLPPIGSIIVPTAFPPWPSLTALHKAGGGDGDSPLIEPVVLHRYVPTFDVAGFANSFSVSALRGNGF